jgi:hypothetical protein
MKQFDLEDQRRFAVLSGDWNPLHMDPVYSRRLLFGEPVVHGVHLVLYALEQLLQNRSSRRALKRLKAVFSHPLHLNKPFHMRVIAADNDGFEIRGMQNECHMLGQFYAEENDEYWSVSLPRTVPPSKCRELSFAEASEMHGVAPLYLNEEELRSMFPSLEKIIPAVQMAEILATTRLTGMDCPGLHAIFHSLDLHFEPNRQPLEMRYRVDSGDERFSRLRLAVESYGASGELSVFFRPGPVAQPSIAEAAEKVRSGEFKGVRALIVGGSRGLGELTAKIIAAGGGEVRLTYNLGRNDADRVVNEINGAQGKCSFFQLDVLKPLPSNWAEMFHDWRPTHLFYFATPYFGPAHANKYAPCELYNLSYDYLMGFSRLLESILSWNQNGLKVLFPSTALLNVPEKGLEEYIEIKSAGELLCQYYAERHASLEFHIPRLPRMKTDETAALRPSRTAENLKVMLEEIRKMEGMDEMDDIDNRMQK